MDTFPIPHIPDYLKSILDNESECWPRALRAAVEHSESFELIRWIVMEFVGPEAERLDGTFSWITILEEAGWTREKLAELMLARFKADDPNVDDFSGHRRREFLCHPPAWRVATDDDLAEFVEAEVREHPTEVLEQNAALAARLGAREADRLAVLACRCVRGLSKAAVDTIMRLGGRIAMNVAQRVVISRLHNSGVPMCRIDELRLLAYAAMETYFDEGSTRSIDIWLGVRASLAWLGSKNEIDRDRPFRVFRWLLKFAEEAPFTVERGMRDPDAFRRWRHEDFLKRLRQTTAELHYGFTTVAQTEHQGQRQLVAVVEDDRGGELKFIESHRPSPHHDVIQDGDEVLVTLRPDGKPAFAYRGGRGFITNLHPVAKPTPAMEAAVATRYGVV